MLISAGELAAEAVRTVPASIITAATITSNIFFNDFIGFSSFPE
jgi:hypothetical protein